MPLLPKALLAAGVSRCLILRNFNDPEFHFLLHLSSTPGHFWQSIEWSHIQARNIVRACSPTNIYLSLWSGTVSRSHYIAKALCYLHWESIVLWNARFPIVTEGRPSKWYQLSLGNLYRATHSLKISPEHVLFIFCTLFLNAQRHIKVWCQATA